MKRIGMGILIITCSLFLVACTEENIDQTKTEPQLISGFSPSICIEKTCFHIEIADTEEKREYGLMNRTTLPEQSGMLFIFEKENQYTFWMKNTLIPLDMIWIDSNMNVVGSEEAIPCTGSDSSCAIYNPGKPASYVLEINYGLVKKLGIKEGQKAVITR